MFAHNPADLCVFLEVGVALTSVDETLFSFGCLPPLPLLTSPSSSSNDGMHSHPWANWSDGCVGWGRVGLKGWRGEVYIDRLFNRSEKLLRNGSTLGWVGSVGIWFVCAWPSPCLRYKFWWLFLLLCLKKNKDTPQTHCWGHSCTVRVPSWISSDKLSWFVWRMWTN